MPEFIFCTAATLSKRYKSSIIRRLKTTKEYASLTGVERVILGDWTLYTGGTEMPTAVINRDMVKSILGAKRLKEW